MARVNVKKEMWIAVFALAVLVTLFAPQVDAGQRITAQVPEDFEINGEMYPPGTLTVREVATYSPVATLNEVCVDGTCGMLLAHETENRQSARQNELTFDRAADGHLVLVGVSLRGQPNRELYEYDAADGGQWLPPTEIAATPRPVIVASNP